MVDMKGTSTKTTYMSSAGRTNSQPIKVSRRKILCREFRREENAGATGRLSDVAVEVTVDDTVDLEGAGIVVTRPYPLLLLSQFEQVLGLDGFEEPGSVLLAADHLLEFGCPALGEDGARRIGDEVHRAA